MASHLHLHRAVNCARGHLEHRDRQPSDAGVTHSLRSGNLGYSSVGMGVVLLALGQVDAVKNPRLRGRRNYRFSWMLSVQPVQREHGTDL